VQHSTSLSDLSLAPGTADLALVRLPKGAQPTRQRLWDAFLVLRPGGQLLIAGANDEGIRPALRQAEALFGNATILAYGKGHRVARAIRPASPPPLPAEFTDPLLDHQAFSEYSLTRYGYNLTICGRPGVFGWDHLDAGSAALIDAIDASDALAIAPDDRVLDLGCGTGVVGAVAARLAVSGAVTLVDSAADALHSTRRTLARNQITNATVIASDGVTALAGQAFDVVVTNPPFHQAQRVDYTTAVRFVEGAAAVLARGGRFYLVANRFIAYEPMLERAFGQVASVWTDQRYKVLMARQTNDTHGEHTTPGREQPRPPHRASKAAHQHR
jgi:16S rRNA (guanine1207-N2)-methyltransferase